MAALLVVEELMAIDVVIAARALSVRCDGRELVHVRGAAAAWPRRSGTRRRTKDVLRMELRVLAWSTRPRPSPRQSRRTAQVRHGGDQIRRRLRRRRWREQRDRAQIVGIARCQCDDGDFDGALCARSIGGYENESVGSLESVSQVQSCSRY